MNHPFAYHLPSCKYTIVHLKIHTQNILSIHSLLEYVKNDKANIDTCIKFSV